tara:strand:+ start:8123 stop:9358 length:1236 start_codon:yes stop_codon:yes gene_type:complete
MTRLAVTGVAIADCMGSDGIENNFDRYMKDDTSVSMDIDAIKSSIVEKGLLRKAMTKYYDRSTMTVLDLVDKAKNMADIDFKSDIEAPIMTGTTRGPITTTLEYFQSYWFEKWKEEHEEDPAKKAEIYQGLIKKFKRMNPYFLLNVNIDFLQTEISRIYGLHGPVYQSAATCSSGIYLLDMAKAYLERGNKYAILTGYEQLDAHELTRWFFMSLGAAAPDGVCRPFDKNRTGTVLRNSYAAMIVEREDEAKKRGAKILCYVDDVRNRNDAGHPMAPADDGKAYRMALESLMKDKDITYDDIDYVNAHATGTPRGDEIELNTLKDYLPKGTTISALKGHIGHAMGACTLAEITYTCMMMNKGIALHTANLKDPCDDYFDLITKPKEMQINYALKNSFGFGGRSSVALLSKAD